MVHLIKQQILANPASWRMDCSWLLLIPHPKQKLVSDTGVELLWWWSAGCAKAHNVLWKQTKRGPGGYLGFNLEMKKLLQQSCLQLH